MDDEVLFWFVVILGTVGLVLYYLVVYCLIYENIDQDELRKVQEQRYLENKRYEKAAERELKRYLDTTKQKA